MVSYTFSEQLVAILDIVCVDKDSNSKTMDYLKVLKMKVVLSTQNVIAKDVTPVIAK